MLSRVQSFVAAIVIVSALSPSVSTQSVPAQSGTGAGSPPLASRPVSSASRITEAPSIDGVLDERVWQDAAPLTDFVQAEPFEGQPASERTEVRMLYDDEAIYVGVDAARPRSVADRHDRHAPRRRPRRDGLVPDDLRHLPRSAERVRVRHQRRRHPVRRAGARPGRPGVELGRQLGRQDAARRETAGPPSSAFRCARCATAGAADVGRQLLPQHPAHARARPTGRRCRAIYNLARLSSAGELRGLELETPRNFKLLPYVVSSANRNFTPGATTDLDGDFGFDAKFGVTPQPEPRR